MTHSLSHFAASTTTILGGAGDDTLVFNNVHSSVKAGLEDSLVFSAVVSTGTTVGGGVNSDTLVFNSSVNGAVVTLDGGADSVTL